MTRDLERLVEQQAQELAALRAENSRLAAENAQLRQRLADALARIEELERASARQAAPFRREPRSKVPEGERKRPGRKPGHPGAYRSRPRADVEVEVPLAACPQCGGPVTERVPLVQFIEEIPPLRPVVTRLTTWSGVCAQCGGVHSTHPLQTSRAQGAASTLLGPRALALTALLNKHLGLPMRRTCQVLKKICGLSITPGGLSQALDRMADRVAGEFDALIQQIRGSQAVFSDETSWWVGQPGWWLWTFATPQATAYWVDRSRGNQVVRQVLGEEFAGTLVSDCLSSYDPLPYRKHKCFAHHLRAIHQARDRPDTTDPRYLDQWKRFFRIVSTIWSLRTAMSADAYAERRKYIEAWCDRLLAEPCTQPGDLAIRNRLEKQRPHLLGCLYEPAAEPTNNRAERALRPAVIARKLSCGNKTRRGRDTWQTLASLAQTCHQQAQDFVDWIAPRLAMHSPPAG